MSFTTHKLHLAGPYGRHVALCGAPGAILNMRWNRVTCKRCLKAHEKAMSKFPSWQKRNTKQKEQAK